MADYDMTIKLPQPTQNMSLGDMVNLAGNIQNYQQAQKINPLTAAKAAIDAQKAQLDLQQAQQTNPLTLEKARQEMQQSQIGTKQKQLELDQSHFNLAGNVLSGLEARAGKLAENKDKDTALKELDYAKKWLISSGVPEKENGPFQLAEEALKKGDFATYQGALENMRNIMAGASSRYQANLPALTTSANAPAIFNAATGKVSPVTMGNAQGQPNVADNQQNVAPQGVTQTQMQLQYPVRRAGDIRPLAPNEQTDTERGAIYRNNLTSRQTDLATSRRNLDEVIKQAAQIEKEDLFSSGFLGSAERTLKGLVGDPKYKQLSKDLANVQIANIQAQGGSLDTVAGQQLTKMANGDETYPPQILINIARRTYADLTNLDMQATAASKFAQKYGDSNLNTFKRQWSSNADSKVFEAISIFNNVKDPQKRKQAIDDLFGTNPEQRQMYFQKYNNIKKLTDTGEL